MTVEEMLIAIPKLTIREQLLLLEAVSRALRTDIEAYERDQPGAQAADRTAFWASFGAWKETRGEPSVGAPDTERSPMPEPPVQ